MGELDGKFLVGQILSLVSVILCYADSVPVRGIGELDYQRYLLFSFPQMNDSRIKLCDQVLYVLVIYQG